MPSFTLCCRRLPHGSVKRGAKRRPDYEGKTVVWHIYHIWAAFAYFLYWSVLFLNLTPSAPVVVRVIYLSHAAFGF